VSRVFRQALSDTREDYDVLLTHLSVIRDLVHLAHSAASFEELCARLAERLVTGLGYERVSVVAVRGGEPLAIAGSYSQVERLAGVPEASPPTLVALARDVMAERDLLRWSDEGIGARRPLPAAFEGCVVGLPLAIGGECVGAVLCEEVVAAPWDLARQRALELIGEIVEQVVTLTQVRLSMTELQREIAAELGTSLTRISDQEETLRAQSERISDLATSLVASSQAKNTFLGLMSHELRTPLSVILGFGSILHDGLAGPVTAEQEQHLERVLSNGRHLNQLIDDMLFFVDAETTRITPAWSRVDLDQLIGEVVESLPETQRKAAPAFTVTIAPDAAVLRTDPALLRRVLFHLVGNAFKFTERGSVRFEVTRAGEEAATAIRITDTGIGILPDQLGRIDALFQPGDDTHTRRRDGVGLGLNLVRACLVLLRGRCRLERGPEGGTQATLWIPEAGAAVGDPVPTDGDGTAARRAELGFAAGDHARDVNRAREINGAQDGDQAREGVSREAASSSASGRAGSARG
jgi:signal transduction histidine kinase